MKNGTLAHLLPAARKQAELGNDERIFGLLRDRWIDYPRATQALQQLERLYETPRRDRMPCLLLHCDSNIGKTKSPPNSGERIPTSLTNEAGSNVVRSFPCRCRRLQTNIDFIRGFFSS